jgi:hypothetical protein
MDQRAWREARERLIRRIEVALTVAIIHFVVILAIILVATIESGAVIRGWQTAVEAAVRPGLAYAIYRSHSRSVAGTLVALVVLMTAYRFMLYGELIDLLLPAVQVYFYARAFFATIELSEMPKQPQPTPAA